MYVKTTLTPDKRKRFNELMDLLNNANEHGYDFHVFDMLELNSMLVNYKPNEVANMIHFGKFNPNHDFFRFNVYGNLISYDVYGLLHELEDVESYLLHYANKE